MSLSEDRSQREYRNMNEEYVYLFSRWGTKWQLNKYKRYYNKY